MRNVLIAFLCMLLSSCARESQMMSYNAGYDPTVVPSDKRLDYASRIPDVIDTRGEKAIVIYPREHVWGAYDESGALVKASLATAGGEWCDDINRPCKTSVGSFRVQSLGNQSCKSKIYPKPNGGGLMPYCMFFSGGMALHGSPSNAVVEGNISHGCVRMFIEDAEWLRFNFASIGTRVIVKPY